MLPISNLGCNLQSYGAVIDWVRQFFYIRIDIFSQAFVSGLALNYLNLSLTIELRHEEKTD
jgi:hypothetical protein